MYSHHTSHIHTTHIHTHSMDQPSKVANPARGQLNRDTNIFLSPFAPENLVSRDGFDRSIPRQPAHSPHSGWIWCLLTGFLPISAAASILSYRQTPSGSVPSSSGHANAYRWRSLPRVRRHRASSPQGSSGNGCCLGRSSWTNSCAPLFSHTHYEYWYGVGMLKVSITISSRSPRVQLVNFSTNWDFISQNK